jgi:hypothetical protein
MENTLVAYTWFITWNLTIYYIFKRAGTDSTIISSLSNFGKWTSTHKSWEVNHPNNN